MKKLILTLILAFCLWTAMFSPWTAPHVPFWWTMTGSALILYGLSTWFKPNWWLRVHWNATNILLGIGIAIGLWGIFWIGDKVSGWLFDFARPQVNAIYGMKAGESPWLLSALMLFLIGPAEEIYWRGYVQQTLSQAQFHANHGGLGGGHRLGSALPFLPGTLLGHHPLPCALGRGGLHLVPDLSLPHRFYPRS